MSNLWGTLYYSVYQQIPILIPFNEIGNQDIVTIIKSFLCKGTEVVKELLRDNKITILIDNICFEEEKKHRLNALISFFNTFNTNGNIRLISTYSQLLENTLIPTNSSEYQNKFNFNLCFLHDLDGKQIRNLITNWYAETDKSVQIENIQRFFDSFNKFALRRTPLSVTMFLWIIEKQERKAVNNAVLVEMFLDKLLEKANFDNAFRATFDFKDKVRLLSHISFFLLKNGNADDSYSCEKSELLKYVTKYLNEKGPFDSNRIIDNLIERKVFEECENSMKFKSNFFFSFFLANFMLINPEFKEEVLAEENYLNYIEEIDYYTGLKTDDVDILKITQERLLLNFGELLKELRGNYHLIDKTFETKNTLAQSLNLKTLPKRSNEEIEKSIDDALDSPVEVKKIEKKEEIKQNFNIGKMLKLAAYVVRNSYDIDTKKLSAAYVNVLQLSIVFLLLYRDLLIRLKNEEHEINDFIPKNIDFGFFVRLLPTIHQLCFSEWIGSVKLYAVLKDKIGKDKQAVNISELEKFISIYTFADLRLDGFENEIKDYINPNQPNYIKDQNLFKIISYYFLRSKTIQSDNFYEGLLADIKQSTKNLHPSKRKEFIEGLKENKNAKLNNSKVKKLKTKNNPLFYKTIKKFTKGKININRKDNHFKHLGRNEKVNVEYLDGSKKINIKFKMVENDIKNGKCNLSN